MTKNLETEGSPPLVTVVIPAYNRESCVGHAIESALAQDTDFKCEVIVVDDGSTDRTAQIARAYSYPVRVISKQNGGPSSARNTGVLAAESEFIALLDSDDLMVAGRLCRQVQFMLAHPDVVLTFGDAVVEPGPASPSGKSYLRDVQLPYVEGEWLTVVEPYRRLLTRRNFVTNVTTMFRKRDYIRAGMMDESLRVAEDFELWARMCSMGKFAYYCTPFARVNRDLDGNLMSSSHVHTDIARARHKVLMRDRVLNAGEKQEAIALLRTFVGPMLRYDLLERGRRQMVKDLHGVGCWFGKGYFLRWWIVSLIPRSVARSIRYLRRKKSRL